VNGKCWYASTQCETTQAMCSSVGLPGTVGYTAVTWDAAALQAVADALGLVAGGLNGCCVEFAWVQNKTIFTHNYGSQYYNWDMCFNNLPTVEAGDLPGRHTGRSPGTPGSAVALLIQPAGWIGPVRRC